MDLRKSLSKPFKKLKDKFPGGGHKRDGRSASKDSRGGGVADIEGGEVSQRNSFLPSEVSIEGSVGGGPGGEGSNVDGKKVVLVDVDPPVSTPSISHIGEPDGTRRALFPVLPLIGPYRQCGEPHHS